MSRAAAERLKNGVSLILLLVAGFVFLLTFLRSSPIL
jgi:hypothetical protein